MRVVSLFDGISAGMLALERAGINVERYIAYEIEDNAITISKHNYPQIEQCGNVFNANFSEYHGFDMVIGGSPCQLWSKAKCHTAKQKREFDTTGGGWQLFEEYLRAIKEIEPQYFLFENNYGIPDTIKEQITKALGVEPLLIDSALVSAQCRKRYYWTNIPNITQPKDKGLLIRDIIVEDKNLLRQFDERIKNTIVFTKNYAKYDLSGKGYFSQQDRLYYLNNKAPTVPRSRTETKFNVWLGGELYKKTCPIESERLQTFPDNYTLCEGIKKTARFEALGNSWTVDTIAHIFSFIQNKT